MARKKDKKDPGGRYVLTLEASLTKAQYKQVDAMSEVCRQIENTVKGLLLKKWRGIKGNPQWRAALARHVELARRQQRTEAELAEMKALSATMREIERSFGLSEYDMHKVAASVNAHFGRKISINEAQRAATTAWRAFEKYRYGDALKLRFKRKGEPVTIENKSNDSGLREKDGRLLTKKKFSAPLILKKVDRYAEMAVQDETCYVRLIPREIRGRRRAFVQIVKKGTPPAKKRTVGPVEQIVGIDIGPSSAAVHAAGTKKAMLRPLPTGEREREEAQIKNLQKRIARSLRLTNPNCFDENGAWKKEARPHPSKKCLKAQAAVRDLRRKQVARRTSETNQFANDVCALGGSILVEDHGVKGWVRRAKTTAKNPKNGRIRSKKRFGGSVRRHAPAAFLNAIEQRVARVPVSKGSPGKLLKVNARRVKASQLNHATGECAKKKLSQRWFKVDGHEVQRDLYAAFILSHVPADQLDKVDLEACRRDWEAFLKAHEAVVADMDKELTTV